LFSIVAHREHSFHYSHFCIQCREFQLVIWMWEFQPIEREKHAIDREERSSQQFHINNIGRRPAIRAENRCITHNLYYMFICVPMDPLQNWTCMQGIPNSNHI
jgi:hypothetical protein